MNTAEFRQRGKEMIDYICNYRDTLPQRQVTPDVDPHFLKISTDMPEDPDTYEEVMKDFEEKIMPGILHWAHPMYFGYFATGGSYPSILGDMLGDGIPCIGFSWTSCPAITELEYAMIDMFTKALNLPPNFHSHRIHPQGLGGGSLQGSASDATFTAMNSARYRVIKAMKGSDTQQHDSFYLPRLVAYTSSEAHSSVEKAARMNLVRLHVLKPDEHDNLRGETLQKAINYDMAHGLVPFFVCGTVGTTSQVAFDNIYEIGQVASQYPYLWFHVDGAYGGNSFILPEMNKFKKGLEFADSFMVNPNKLLMTAFDCTVLFVSNVLEFVEAFVINPLYLEHQYDDSVIDLRHFGCPLSRRFRSLKLYFMFRLYGLKKLQEYVRGVISAGKKFEALVNDDDRFEVMNDVHLGCVCFRLKGSDALNGELCHRLNYSLKIHVTPAMARGKKIIRFVAGHEVITDEMVNNAWKYIQDFATKLLAEIEHDDE